MTPIEVLWTAVAALGLGVNGKGLFDALQDRAAVARSGLNGYRRRIAVGRVRAESVRVLVQMLFVAAGVLALTDRSTGGALAAIFIAAALLLVADALGANRHRAALIADLVAEDRRPGGRRRHDPPPEGP